MTPRELDENMSAVCKVARGIPLPDLEKLCNAWRDGRAVMLPCKEKSGEINSPPQQ